MRKNEHLTRQFAFAPQNHGLLPAIWRFGHRLTSATACSPCSARPCSGAAAAAVGRVCGAAGQRSVSSPRHEVAGERAPNQSHPDLVSLTCRSMHESLAMLASPGVQPTAYTGYPCGAPTHPASAQPPCCPHNPVVRSLGEYASERAGNSSGRDLVRGFFVELEGLDGALREVRPAPLVHCPLAHRRPAGRLDLPLGSARPWWGANMAANVSGRPVAFAQVVADHASHASL